MVAVAQFIPNDPEQKESVLAVLREHPELPDFILRASEKAQEIFSDVRITLDTVRYDEWDPPVRMIVHSKSHPDIFENLFSRYTHWLAYDANYPDDLIQVMPMWAGPRVSAQ
jgi:hypothetical protein